jgi:hypothetical protein
VFNEVTKGCDCLENFVRRDGACVVTPLTGCPIGFVKFKDNCYRVGRSNSSLDIKPLNLNTANIVNTVNTINTVNTVNNVNTVNTLNIANTGISNELNKLSPI